MIYCNLFIISFLVSSALRVESIVGGRLAKQSDFKYQVAVLGRNNYSYNTFLICGGGIIASKFVLSLAHCFFTSYTRLRRITYSIVAGTDDLLKQKITEDVDCIYTPNSRGEWLKNDIAVLKLNNSMNILNHPHLNKVQIPFSKVPLTGKKGKLAGFGDVWSQTGFDPVTKKKIRTFGGSDDLLYFADVQIISNDVCKAGYNNFSCNTQLCGSISSSRKAAGFCSGDAGDPLVIDNKLVGLASINNPQCDDDTFGSVFIKVSYFSLYINRVMGGVSEVEGTYYKNRPHILQNKLVE